LFFDDGLHIHFPTFSTKAILGTDDVYLDGVLATLASNSQPSPMSNLSVEVLKLSDNSQVDCQHITQRDTTVFMKSQKEDNLLCNLRHNYDEVKTK